MSTEPGQPQPIPTKVKVSGFYIGGGLIAILCFGALPDWAGVPLGWLCVFAIIYRVLRHYNKVPALNIAWLQARAASFAGVSAPSAATAAAPIAADQMVLGHTLDTAAPVILSDRQLSTHGLILGASGSGKSTSLLAILCDEIGRGAPVVAIDLKGSTAFAEQLEAAAHAAGRPFRQWQPDGPTHWNPLTYGSATELKDKLISAESFSEPHYQRAAERYLQTAAQVLQAAAPERPITLAGVVGVLDPNTLKAMLLHVPRELAARVAPYLNGMSNDQRSAVLGLQSRLAILSESSVGEYLQPSEDQIDLRHALTEGDEVVLFSLNASRFGKLTGQLAAMVVQDLIAIAGHRQNDPSKHQLALIALDEFSALDVDNIINLFTRSREAGMSVLLSTQELADLERLAAGLQEQVLGNIGILLAHRQNVPASAELIAAMIGTHSTWERTVQTEQVLGWRGVKTRGTGVGTSKQVEEFTIHPNVIKQLGVGEAVLVTKTPSSSATVMHVDPWNAS